jgi:hypothetical protein
MVLDIDTDHDELICDADFYEVAFNRVHYPEAASLSSQVVRAVCDEVPFAHAVVAGGACKVLQVLGC